MFFLVASLCFVFLFLSLFKFSVLFLLAFMYLFHCMCNLGVYFYEINEVCDEDKRKSCFGMACRM